MVMVMNDNNYKFGSSFSIQSTNTMLILFILLIKDLAVISYETHFYYTLNLIYKEPAFECCKIFFAVIVTVNYLHNLYVFQPKYPLVEAKPSTLCKEPQNHSEIKDAAVAIQRGNCTLFLKALYSQNAGAKEVVIVSNDSLVSEFSQAQSCTCL